MCTADRRSRSEIVTCLQGMLAGSLEEELDADTFGEATRLDSLGLNSLAILNLLFDLEEEFGLEIDAETMGEMGTVGDLVSYLQEQGA